MQKARRGESTGLFRGLGIPKSPFCCLLAAHPALPWHVEPGTVVARPRNDVLRNADLSVPDAAGWALPALTVPIGVLHDRAVATPTNYRTGVGELLTLG